MSAERRPKTRTPADTLQTVGPATAPPGRRTAGNHRVVVDCRLRVAGESPRAAAPDPRTGSRRSLPRIACQPTNARPPVRSRCGTGNWAETRHEFAFLLNALVTYDRHPLRDRFTTMPSPPMLSREERCCGNRPGSGARCASPGTRPTSVDYERGERAIFSTTCRSRSCCWGCMAMNSIP
jgi:hypothetical protein